jgi:hypothetical protein
MVKALLWSKKHHQPEGYGANLLDIFYAVMLCKPIIHPRAAVLLYSRLS